MRVADQAHAAPTRWRWASGAVAAGAALGVSELLAGLVTAVPSLVSGVATLVIDTVPPAVERWAIETFGTADKLVLGVGIVVVTLLLGALVGRAGRLTRAVVFVGFGVGAALVASRDPQVDLAAGLIGGVVSALAGLAVLGWLAGSPDRPADLDRRAFLFRAGAVALLAGMAAYLGRSLIERGRRMVAGRNEVALPAASDPVSPPPPAASLEVEGITPIITPNPVFYRIDTAPFSVPRVDLATWRLRITGLVEREVELDFADLLDLPMVERYVTLACVSNEVGGDLIGNAKWLGTPLPDLLDRAGVAPGAEQVVGRAVDGFTVGFPVEAAFDGREALVAVGMNDEPLPFEHGFPARLVVAGLYGYVSATKWLSEIELTTWDGFDAYWVPRGWAKEAPIKTQSRIDVPQGGGPVPAGPTTIAGVAWAPTRGISRVEVRVDRGEWVAAEVSEPLSEDTWVQWRAGWDALPGRHTLQVRAADGDGVFQTEVKRPPAPDGATGYHTVRVEVV